MPNCKASSCSEGAGHQAFGVGLARHGSAQPIFGMMVLVPHHEEGTREAVPCIMPQRAGHDLGVEGVVAKPLTELVDQKGMRQAMLKQARYPVSPAKSACSSRYPGSTGAAQAGKARIGAHRFGQLHAISADGVRRDASTVGGKVP